MARSSAAALEPYDRSRDHFVRVVGLGRRTMAMMGLATVLSSAAAGAHHAFSPVYDASRQITVVRALQRNQQK